MKSLNKCQAMFCFCLFFSYQKRRDLRRCSIPLTPWYKMNWNDKVIIILTQGRGVANLSIFLPLHKNDKATDPGLLYYLFYIFCAHFDKKMRVPPKMGVGQASTLGGEGVVTTQHSCFETKSVKLKIILQFRT